MCIKRVVGIGGGWNLPVILGRSKQMGRSKPSYSDHRSEAGRGNVEVPCNWEGWKMMTLYIFMASLFGGSLKTQKLIISKFQRRKKERKSKKNI